MLRLGSNESPFGPSPRALLAIAGATAQAHRYGDPSERELREAIAHHHGVDAANVTVGAGIDDLLGWIVRAFVAPGGTTVATLGTFPTFEMHANGYGTSLERVPYRPDGRPDLDALLAALWRRGGGLVYLANPDNPSGSAAPWSDVKAFVDAMPDRSLAIHDEAYANFLPPDARFPPAALGPRMIRLRTFSKEYGLAGLRIGYALGVRAAIAALDDLRLLYGVGRVAQAAALAALADGGYITEVISRIGTGRAEYQALGTRLGAPTLPSSTNFVLFDFGTRARAEAVLEALLGQGIHVRKPAAAPLDRCVRISIGLPADRERLAGALTAIVRDLPA